MYCCLNHVLIRIASRALQLQIGTYLTIQTLSRYHVVSCCFDASFTPTRDAIADWPNWRFVASITYFLFTHTRVLTRIAREHTRIKWRIFSDGIDLLTMHISILAYYHLQLCFRVSRFNRPRGRSSHFQSGKIQSLVDKLTGPQACGKKLKQVRKCISHE